MVFCKKGNKLPSNKTLEELGKNRQIRDGSIRRRVRRREPWLLENRCKKCLLEGEGENASVKGKVEKIGKERK
jgi:hypothetical protein